MNSIYFGNKFILNDYCLKNGSIALQNSMIAESLEADTLNIRLLDKAWGWIPFKPTDADYFIVDSKKYYVEGEAENVPTDELVYGEPVYYEKDGRLVGKFYFRQYKRIPTDEIEIQCLSAIGMLGFIEHRGGIYTGETVEDIVFGWTDTNNVYHPGIIPDDGHGNPVFSCTIDPEVASVPVFGWLPIASARDNLVQVMFQCGASILKSDEGELHIGYNDPYQVAVEIPNDTVMMAGRQIAYMTPATSVTVVEHTYTASPLVIDTVLFDNRGTTAADHTYLQFDAPYHTLTSSQTGGVDDLTIHESGANYAIVSGSGYLTGKEYVHNQRKVVRSTGVVGETNEKTVSNCTLVNTLNINNVVARVAAYYSIAVADSFTFDIDDDSIRPGMFISYPDPNYDGVGEIPRKTGYVMSVDYTIGNTLSASVTVANEWKPNHLGNSFTDSIVITAEDLENGVWTVPDEYVGQPASITIFGGGSGGFGSYNGAKGNKSSYSQTAYRTYSKNRNQYTWLSGVLYAKGGEGGAPGKGGLPGNFYTFTVDELAASYNVTLGVGGTGGEANGGTDPTDGTDSTFGSHSSSEGTPFGGNYIDLITGDMYAKIGEDGHKGGDGGGAGCVEPTAEGYPNGNPNFIDYALFHGGATARFAPKGEDGETVGTYVGGKGATSVEFWRDSTSSEYNRYGCGSGGGGSTDSASGTDATDPTTTQFYPSQGQTYNSTPGNGANATKPAKETLGSGGKGACGGGGGGSAGVYYETKTTNEGDETIRSQRTQPEGTFGTGADGGDGGDGFILIYTSPRS